MIVTKNVLNVYETDLGNSFTYMCILYMYNINFFSKIGETTYSFHN